MEERWLDVPRAVDYLEEVLGAVWLKENLKLLKNYAGGGAGFGRSIELSSSGVAAAAYYWYRAREELTLGLISGQRPGVSALQAAVIGDDLRALRGSRGLTDIIEWLKQPEDTGQALVLPAIASGYARRGDKVVFTGPEEAFYVSGVRKEQVFVEHCRQHPEGIYAEGFSVVYRHRCRHGYDPDNGFDKKGAGPGTTDCSANGAPLVYCSFIARRGLRGPEIVRTGRLIRGCLSRDVYVPGEIIMPG